VFALGFLPEYCYARYLLEGSTSDANELGGLQHAVSGRQLLTDLRLDLGTDLRASYAI
jgi:hypothetical protein